MGERELGCKWEASRRGDGGEVAEARWMEVDVGLTFVMCRNLGRCENLKSE